MNLGCESLNDRLGRWAVERRDNLAITFLKRGDVPDGSLTFGALYTQATAVAHALVAKGLRGQSVLLAFPSGIDFITALFGCFLSGTIAVPVPYPLQSNAFERLVRIAHSASARAVLVPGAGSEILGLSDAFAQMPQLEIIGLQNLQSEQSQNALPVDMGLDHPAFLQFTSGSTGHPKGVIITHRNLAANMEMIRTAFGSDDTTRSVSWLPTFHDMGLVGQLLQPVWLGIPVWLMSPYAFLQRPMRWLQAISTYRATVSGAPNFAYEVISKQLTQQKIENLDLSSWKVAFCGAEPVRAASLDRFAKLLAPVGFNRHALFPCYGMAEATLFVSGGPAGTGVKVDDQTGATCCGQVAYPAGLRVVDPKTLADVGEGARGEILLRGPHITKGYWNDDAANLAGFTNDAAGQSWLRTGDLGMLNGDRLSIVGRLKDQVIVRGVNYSAEEIEAALCQSDPKLLGSPAVVFNSGHDLVGIIEMRTRPSDAQDFALLAETANAAVTRAFGVRLDRIVFWKWGALPRTTSGKIRRHAAQVAFGADLSLEDLIYEGVYKS